MDLSSVLQTLHTSQQLAATPQQRIQATQLFEQLKAGEVHSSAAVATELLKPSQPAELQVLGYTLLQHLVSGAAGAGRACARAVMCAWPAQARLRPPPCPCMGGRALAVPAAPARARHASRPMPTALAAPLPCRWATGGMSSARRSTASWPRWHTACCSRVGRGAMRRCLPCIASARVYCIHWCCKRCSALQAAGGGGAGEGHLLDAQ